MNKTKGAQTNLATQILAKNQALLIELPGNVGRQNKFRGIKKIKDIFIF